MEENEEGEVDDVDAVSACVGRICRDRPKMKDENEKEDEGVEEGELGEKEGIWKRVFHTKNGALIRKDGGERGGRS